MAENRYISYKQNSNLSSTIKKKIYTKNPDLNIMFFNLQLQFKFKYKIQEETAKISRKKPYPYLLRRSFIHSFPAESLVSPSIHPVPAAVTTPAKTHIEHHTCFIFVLEIASFQEFITLIISVQFSLAKKK